MCIIYVGGVKRKPKNSIGPDGRQAHNEGTVYPSNKRLYKHLIIVTTHLFKMSTTLPFFHGLQEFTAQCSCFPWLDTLVCRIYIKGHGHNIFLHIIIILTLQTDLPNNPQPIHIELHSLHLFETPHSLQQFVDNLVLNAVHYTEHSISLIIVHLQHSSLTETYNFVQLHLVTLPNSYHTIQYSALQHMYPNGLYIFIPQNDVTLYIAIHT